MLTAAIALGLLAVALAWPVPLVLGRASWPSRAPATALVLWQAIALAGGLSMIGSLLVLGLAPFGADLVSAARELARTLADPALLATSTVPAGYVVALGAAALLAGHLLLNLGMTITRTLRDRRRHRALLLLLSSPHPDRPGAHVIDDPAPVAYCLPGTASSLTVVSAGLLALLDDRELGAVMAHERAHLSQRHDVVLMLFRAWSASLPWFPIASRAEREVGILVEMLADDLARRSADDRVLATAIALTAGTAPGDADAGPTTSGASGVMTPSARAAHARVSRLIPASRPLRGPWRALVFAASAALLVVPTALLLAPALAG
ncbi:MAG: M56 family metallopeptidase [Microbacteriaceae bacterium]